MLCDVPPRAGTIAERREAIGGWVMPAAEDRLHQGEVWDADQALEQLYAAHWAGLVRLSVLLVRDQGTAEEIVQDSFVAVHARWHSLHDPDRALAYLRQTIVNRSRSVLRHRKVVARHLESAAAQSRVHQAEGDDITAVSDRRRRVLDAVSQLPRRQREVVALRYYLDLSEAEIAAILGISRGAVKSHGSRGAAALRARLADAMEAHG